MSDASDETRAMLTAFQRVCVGPAVSAEDVAVLESEVTRRARFELYRDLVRIRLRDLVCAAFPRTTEALGKPKMFALANDHVTAAPPPSRFFREHAAAFAAWALPVLAAEPTPAFVVDLLRLEAAQWQANYTPNVRPPDLADFDLEGIAVRSSSLVTLTVGFGVHRPSADGPPAPGTFRLAVYRRPDHRVETRWMEPIWADLLDAMAAGAQPAIDCVRAVLKQHGRAADAAFVDEMTTFVSLLVENGALLGSRPGEG
jgi:hypothetical protein